jgi:tetratricopeptide (TPR) repeat protein
MHHHHRRLSVAAVAALFGLAVCAGPVAAAGDPDGGNAPKPAPSEQKGSAKKKKKQQQSEQQLREGYLAARALIMDGKYQAGIAAMHALHQDNNAEVANYIGFAERKLGHYDAAKIWYEKALAADPKHTRTWQYYGMWHLEQGNFLKASDHLDKIRLICGNTECNDYKALEAALDGKGSY